MSNFTLKSWGLDSRKYNFKSRAVSAILFIAYIAMGFIFFSGIDFFRLIDFFNKKTMPSYNPHVLLSFLYLLIVTFGVLCANYYRRIKDAGNIYFITIVMSVFFGTIIGFLVELITQSIFVEIYTSENGVNFSSYFKSTVISMWPEYTMIFILFSSTLIIKSRMKSYQFNVQRQSKDTSSNLGSARMASSDDINRYGLRENTGALIGKDDKGYIRYPKLTDRLILAFRGSGKTSSLLVPLILDYMHVNKFITDIKGELAIITARRAIAAGRDVFIIDPFSVLKSHDVHIQTHSINPLAYLNFNNHLDLDRTITAIATALCSSDSVSKNETERHFSENAQIILEGILDFYITKFKDHFEKMNLVAMHDWWLDVVNDPKADAIKEMQNGSHKARAAAAQLSSAGKDESGSMRTTVYRQLQWLRGDSIRKIFVENELNIDAFISGNCDIYVVIPEDMVKAYSRMVRVVMALIKVKLIQAKSTHIKNDYYFILDECGQFGYCPDIEAIINTLRYKGVKVCASFQTLEQVEVYHDSSVFKGMTIKQFLGSDDIKTLKWIQELGDKKTVLIENISRNTSRPHKGGRASVSENHSVSETATDLIHFSDVREMKDDEQYVFIKGMRPIRCKKAYYFKEPMYKDKFDKNILEDRG